MSNKREEDEKVVHQEEEPVEDTAEVVEKKRKSVGFAPVSEEVREFRQERIDKAKEKFHDFHKVPPELAYLRNKGTIEKPEKKMLAQAPVVGPEHNERTHKTKSFEEVRDIRYIPVKEFSIQNKETEFNFHYPEIDLPIPSSKILVRVDYASLNSFDFAKVNSYALNLSNTMIGLGYEYAGKIVAVGKNFQGKYSEGQSVFGCVDPNSRKGTMTTSLLLNPNRDIIIVVDDELNLKVSEVDAELKLEGDDNDGDFEIKSSSSNSTLSQLDELEQPSMGVKNQVSKAYNKVIPPLAKLTCFPTLYCRAKQVMSHVDLVISSSKKATILINGGDTNLGYTLVQLLYSPQYSYLTSLHIILTVRESSLKALSNFTEELKKGKYYDPLRSRNIDVVSFDLENEDLVLPGETVSLNYKKPNLFASEIINCLLRNAKEPVNLDNINDYKIDMFVDIVGSKRFFQKTSIKFSVIEDISLPNFSKIAKTTSLKQIFGSTMKEPFFLKIMKPKSLGSSFVSCCSFEVKDPTYCIDHQIIFTGMEYSMTLLGARFFSSLSNTVSPYYYYEEVQLKISSKWIAEALDLFLKGYLRFKIDDFVDWRNDIRRYLKLLKLDDKKVIFLLEKFM